MFKNTDNKLENSLENWSLLQDSTGNCIAENIMTEMNDSISGFKTD